MKRIIIIICSLCAIAAISIHSALVLEDVKSSVEHRVNEILIASASFGAGLGGLDESGKENVLKKIDGLHDYWSSKEELMANYIRKNLLEDMSQSMAKLYPIAEYEDWAAFYEELMSINWQMDNIVRSEAFTVANIF